MKTAGEAAKRRIEAFEGIQVNACRNAACPQFGVAPALSNVPKSQALVGYHFSGAARERALICDSCGHVAFIKSNRAVVEELRRITSLTNATPAELRCRNPGCQKQPARFQRFGRTRSGSKRVRCVHCGTTQSISESATFRQKRPDKNAEVLRLLVNKVPMRRLLEVAGISASTLYSKLEHLEKRCLLFAGMHEQKLPEMKFRHLDLAVDRQDYLINWGAHVNRRSFMMRAVASSDARSGFVFGVDPNFDPSQSVVEIEAQARERGDEAREPIDRLHPQYWLLADYVHTANWRAAEVERTRPAHQRQPQQAHLIDPFAEPGEQTPPARGVQVRQEYVLFAHFLRLRDQLQGVEKLVFFMDPDSGLSNAMLSAFGPRTRGGDVLAFHVRSQKNLTVDQRKRVLAQCASQFSRFRAQHPALSEREAALAWLLASFRDARSKGDLGAWIPHPLPDSPEPGKEIGLLTGHGDLDLERAARAALYAGLKSIDRFFMLVRRRISLLERPIHTPASASRTWHGYAPYNPVVACRLLNIFRVVYDYHLAGKDKQTPAMRLGLTEKAHSLHDLLGEPPQRRLRAKR